MYIVIFNNYLWSDEYYTTIISSIKLEVIPLPNNVNKVAIFVIQLDFSISFTIIKIGEN